MQGFYFYTPSMEYFFVTNAKRRTPALCKKIEHYLTEDGCRRVYNGAYHGSFGDFSIHDHLQVATCEIKETENFGKYYDINGEGWGGRGGFAKDGKTKIVVI